MSKINCLLCERDGDYSVPGVIHVPGYDFTVCRRHWGSNRDGWGKHYEEKILEHLRQTNIEVPPRNSEGLLPSEYPKPSPTP